MEGHPHIQTSSAQNNMIQQQRIQFIYQFGCAKIIQ